MLRFSTPELPSELEALRQGTRQTIALLHNQRSLWRVVGKRIARQMLERWGSGGSQTTAADIADLRPSTVEARERGWGYYRRARRFPVRGSEPRSPWWTGKTLNYITSPVSWNANRAELHYHFGRAKKRRLADYMHFGNPAQNRPPRPLYDLGEVEREAQKVIEDYLDIVLAGGSVFLVRAEPGGATA